MSSLYERIHQSKAFIEERLSVKAKTAVVLGTGLGEFAHSLTDTIEIPYSDIPHFPVSTVESHQSKLIFGFKSGVPLIIMAGRFHYYEGYTSAQITFPIRVLKALGVEKLLLTNAAGGINPHFREGDIVLVTDHINLLPDHPLRGPNDDRLGPRFPDMMHAYDKELRDTFKEISYTINIPLLDGVYLGLQGPSLETPAEYRMAHVLGADLVGMSTVPEVIVARHEGLKVVVFSIVANVCFPKSILTETTLEQVISVVNKSSKTLQSLLDKYFDKVNE
ncbi:MAG: purine-nucleoside phosphorylase [Saprospiraceae bacterium]|nr:purine-nucleoside phosphorylase [Saprospiraceae bacterium]